MSKSIKNSKCFDYDSKLKCDNSHADCRWDPVLEPERYQTKMAFKKNKGFCFDKDCNDILIRMLKMENVVANSINNLHSDDKEGRKYDLRFVVDHGETAFRLTNNDSYKNCQPTLNKYSRFIFTKMLSAHHKFLKENKNAVKSLFADCMELKKLVTKFSGAINHAKSKGKMSQEIINAHAGLVKAIEGIIERTSLKSCNNFYRGDYRKHQNNIKFFKNHQKKFNAKRKKEEQCQVAMKQAREYIQKLSHEMKNKNINLKKTNDFNTITFVNKHIRKANYIANLFNQSCVSSKFANLFPNINRVINASNIIRETSGGVVIEKFNNTGKIIVNGNHNSYVFDIRKKAIETFNNYLRR